MTLQHQPGDKLWFHGETRVVPVTYVSKGQAGTATVTYGHDEDAQFPTLLPESTLRTTPGRSTE